jgi:hypothetical protein
MSMCLHFHYIPGQDVQLLAYHSTIYFVHILHLKDPSQIRAWALLGNFSWKMDPGLGQVSLPGRSFQCVLKREYE